VPVPTLTVSSATHFISTATANPFGKIDVGGYQLAYKCFGQGTPTVIIEAGAGDAPASVNPSWEFVTKEIQKITRICVYDRAGIGDSGKAPTPRTSKDIAQDLHVLLHKIPLPGPYIFVAHSIGGYHVRVFAQRYPEDVAGIILVDSSHPDQFKQFAKIYPTVAPAEAPEIAENRAFFSSAELAPTNNPEKLDFIVSAEQADNAGSLGAIPLIVISQSPNAVYMPGFSQEDLQRFSKTWQTLQADLATLSSNSTHLIAQRAGHSIQTQEPKIVITAITQMVQEIQKSYDNGSPP
jgi:pimeloyl-ACP methyl ester carboxylesterase